MPQQAASITAAASCRQSTAVGLEIVWTLPKRILKGIGLWCANLTAALRWVVAIWVIGMAMVSLRAEAPNRDIGIEGDVSFELGRADYQARPLDDRTELILRIESVKPATDGRFIYDFHYMGLEPGSYVLADYLMLPDGSRPDELADLTVQVESRLPLDHSGQLTPFQPAKFPFLGGYRIILGCLGGLWVMGIGAFIWLFRKKKVVAEAVVVIPEPSFAERLHPLVAAAAKGEISVAQQSVLERLVMGYWRHELALPDQRMAEALASLKAHPQAGALLRALERWLHQRGGGSIEEVNGLLEIYRKPTPPEKGAGA